jgi:hypothetical protein
MQAYYHRHAGMWPESGDRAFEKRRRGAFGDGFWLRQ